jgi:CBS domain containing-hemolysin-like protein
LDIDPEQFDNIADFLLEQFNHVPKTNEKLLYENKAEFMILDSSRSRINKIRITIKEPNQDEE